LRVLASPPEVEAGEGSGVLYIGPCGRPYTEDRFEGAASPAAGPAASEAL